MLFVYGFFSGVFVCTLLFAFYMIYKSDIEKEKKKLESEAKAYIEKKI